MNCIELCLLTNGRPHWAAEFEHFCCRSCGISLTGPQNLAKSAEENCGPYWWAIHILKFFC